MSNVSGIVSRPADSGAQRVIPQTRRADGTLRKERKVRDGYVPPEDVTRYANEKVATTARLAPGEVIGYTPPPNKTSSTKTKSQNKNEKKRAKKATETKSSTTAAVEESEQPPRQNEEEEQETQAIDPAKKLKNLRKKLRQAELLKVKLDAGESLLAEQLEKIDKMEELTNEIAQLEIQ